MFLFLILWWFWCNYFKMFVFILCISCILYCYNLFCSVLRSATLCLNVLYKYILFIKLLTFATFSGGSGLVQAAQPVVLPSSWRKHWFRPWHRGTAWGSFKTEVPAEYQERADSHSQNCTKSQQTGTDVRYVRQCKIIKCIINSKNVLEHISEQKQPLKWPYIDKLLGLEQLYEISFTFPLLFAV